jgi:predicted AlkP superfamily phosphohydrolase/phosphomutase
MSLKQSLQDPDELRQSFKAAAYSNTYSQDFRSKCEDIINIRQLSYPINSIVEFMLCRFQILEDIDIFEKAKVNLV